MRRAAGYLAAAAIVAAAFSLGFLLTQTEQGAGQSAPPVRADRPLRLIDEVRAELTSSYYRWIDPDVLERPTVDKILEGLDDPHTDLLSDAEYASLQEHTQGTYSGIGLTVGPARRGLVVTSAAPGPARASRLRSEHSTHSTERTHWRRTNQPWMRQPTHRRIADSSVASTTITPASANAATCQDNA